MTGSYFDREMLSRLRAIPITRPVGGRRLRTVADEIEQRLDVQRRDDSEHGARFMISDDDAHVIVRTLQRIALQCFDLSAVGRLRLLADQIEHKIQTPSAMQTKLSAAGDQGATPSSKSTTRKG